ncbi:MAG: hypothetical protein CK425_08170 [Parachlamydia sp.]|nr:MAG: hypothetical protein CK425_08170 [Parachlamydia sp.]
MDFHLLGEAYAQGKPVASLEGKNASWQDKATEEDIPKFLEKLQNFFEDDPQLIQRFLEGIKGEKSGEVDAEETGNFSKSSSWHGKKVIVTNLWRSPISSLVTFWKI